MNNKKKKIMRSVCELNQNELEELRGRWYSEHMDDGSLYGILGLEEDEEIIEENIPMDIVRSYYSDTFFVEDDFFCNLE